MVRALLAGAKTQTRRAVKLPRWAEPSTDIELDDYAAMFDLRGPYAIDKGTGCLTQITCPYGKAGDTLWVREAFRVEKFEEVVYRADSTLRPEFDPLRYKSSIYMPRRASRITLAVAAVRVERLHEISEADAKAEGVDPADCCHAYHHGYRLLWESIHGEGSWARNPWVWVISFSPVAAVSQ